MSFDQNVAPQPAIQSHTLWRDALKILALDWKIARRNMGTRRRAKILDEAEGRTESEGAGKSAGSGLARWLARRKRERAQKRAQASAANAQKGTKNVNNPLFQLVLLAILVPCCWGVALGLSKTPTHLPAIALWGISLGLIGLLVMLIMASMAGIADTIFLRGDADLLAASPIDPRAVALVRLGNLAISTGVIPIALAIGVSIFLPFYGGWHWMGLVPIMVAISMVACAISLFLARFLVVFFGPKRLRTLVYVLSSAIGLVFFVGVQANNLVHDPATDRGWATQYFVHMAKIVRPDWPLLWPGKALMAGPVGWLAVLALAAFLFGIAAFWAGRQLLAMARANAQGKASRRSVSKRTRQAFSNHPIHATTQKEIRIVSRNPQIILSLVAQIIYLSPLLLVILSNQTDWRGRSLVVVAMVAAVTIASSSSGRAIWIVAGGETAPDLLRASPATARQFQWGKILAATMIGCAMVVLEALAVLIWMHNPLAALGCVCFGLLSGFMAARIAFRFVKPFEMKAFRRPPNGSLQGSLSQGLVTGLLASSAGCFAANLLWIGGFLLLGAIAAFYVFTVEEAGRPPKTTLVRDEKTRNAAIV